MQSDHRRLLVWGARLGLSVVWIAELSLLISDRDPHVWPLRSTLDLLVFMIVPALALFMLALGAQVVLETYLAGAMRRATRRLLFWTPRVLGVLFILLLAACAEGEARRLGVWERITTLIPAFVVLAAIWCWEWLGAVICGVAGLQFAAVLNPPTPWEYLIFAGIPLLVAVLLTLSWTSHQDVRGWRRTDSRAAGLDTQGKAIAYARKAAARLP